MICCRKCLVELGDELQMMRDQEKDLDFQAGLASFVSSNPVPPTLHRKGKIECKKEERGKTQWENSI
jgi:hypothetical protein